jgi:hypothetical protein
VPPGYIFVRHLCWGSFLSLKLCMSEDTPRFIVTRACGRLRGREAWVLIDSDSCWLVFNMAAISSSTCAHACARVTLAFPTVGWSLFPTWNSGPGFSHALINCNEKVTAFQPWTEAAGSLAHTCCSPGPCLHHDSVWTEPRLFSPGSTTQPWPSEEPARTRAPTANPDSWVGPSDWQPTLG